MYTIFVCLEYNGDVEKLAKQVTNTLKNSISDEDRLKIEYNLEQFELKIKNNLKKGNDVQEDNIEQ